MMTMDFEASDKLKLCDFDDDGNFHDKCLTSCEKNKNISNSDFKELVSNDNDDVPFTPRLSPISSFATCNCKHDTSIKVWDTTTMPFKRVFNANNSMDISVKKSKVALDGDSLSPGEWTLVGNSYKNCERKEEELKVLSRKIAEHTMELETTKKELRSERKKLLQVISTKQKHIDCATQMKNFESMKKQYEGQVKELESKLKQCEGRVEELESNEKHFEGRMMEEELESRKKELESKEKLVERREMKLKSKENQLEIREKKVEIKEQRIEEQEKELKFKKQQFERDMKEELQSKENEINSRMRVVESKEKEFENQMKEFEFKKKNLESQVEDLKSKQKQLEGQVKELESKLSKFDGQLKDPESRGKESGATLRLIATEVRSDMNDQLSLAIDGVESLSNDIFFCLQISSDPAELVLDILQNPNSPLYKKENKALIINDGHIYLLELLMLISPNIKPCVREEALKLALHLKANMKENTENSLAVVSFLLLLSIYGLLAYFNDDEVLELFTFVAQHKIALKMYQTLGFANKVSDFVENLIRRKQFVGAVRFSCAYNLAGKNQSVDMLREHVQNAKLICESSCEKTNSIEIKDKARDEEIASLRTVLQCISDNKIVESEDLLRKEIRHRILELNAQKGK